MSHSNVSIRHSSADCSLEALSSSVAILLCLDDVVAMSCCSSKYMEDIGSSEIPKLKLPPSSLSRVVKQATTSGIEVAKLSSSGNARQKLLVLDRRMEKLTFLPSNKPFEDRQIDVADVVQVRIGNDCTRALVDLHLDDAAFGFALILKDGESINMYAGDVLVRERIVGLFSFLLRRKQVVVDENPHRVRLVSVWLQADSDGNGRLSFEELAETLVSLGVSTDRPTLRKLFSEIDRDGSGTLDFEEFCEFFDDITLRPELRGLFEKFAGQGGDSQAMEATELQQFLLTCQKESLSTKAVSQLAAHITSNQPCLSFNDFCGFLLSHQLNGFVNPTHLTVFEPMDRPMHEYNIFAANARSISGLHSLKSLLQSGVRYLDLVVEEKNRRPVLSSCPGVALEDVIRVVAESGFRVSSFPVWLAFRGPSSIVKAAAAVTRRHLARAMIFAAEDARSDGFCTPQMLRNKVIVVGFATDTEENEPFATHPLLGAWSARQAVTKAAVDEVLGSSEINRNRLLLRINEADGAPKDRLGLQPAITLLSGEAPTWEHVLASGAHIAPVSFIDINSALPLAAYFSVNGRSGYRLRPVALREPSAKPPLALLKINVLLGTQIPEARRKEVLRDIVDPFVELSIVGDPQDMAANPPTNTKYVLDNGFSPYWNEEFEFGVRHVDQAFLRLRLLDWNTRDNFLIATSTLPVSSIRSGYRAVSFRNVQGDLLPFTSVLCHFEFTAPATQMEASLRPAGQSLDDTTAAASPSSTDEKSSKLPPSEVPPS